MYYIDTNILIYANSIDSPYHSSSSDIFYSLLAEKKVILHEIVLNEFYAIITDSRKIQSPWSTNEAQTYIIDLLNTAKELHLLDAEIIRWAFEEIDKFNIKRYNVYDHLIAYSMRFFGIDKIVTLNRKDFKKYGFIKEILSPSEG